MIEDLAIIIFLAIVGLAIVGLAIHDYRRVRP